MSGDLDQIMAVMQAAFDPAFGEAWTRRQVGDALLLANTHYLLAGPDGAPPDEGVPAAGFALSRSTIEEEELLLVAVRPEMRRRGIAAALITRFVEQAGKRGAARLFLEMRDGNPAESLYRRLGFVTVGRRPNYYRGGRSGRIDAITFVRVTEK